VKTSLLHPSASITEMFSLGYILVRHQLPLALFTVVSAADFFSLQSRFVIGVDDRKRAI